ncbi:uncharacterized protein LOC127709948 [Mytilus californianus]|uniref:uncharacterized protein LOC127709948 n=1 Tax=Mytilus californianus TaxID=6549 RepID=UPI002245D442|nr:uncharacterized protein LOC127709948 [Mytilus californianus]
MYHVSMLANRKIYECQHVTDVLLGASNMHTKMLVYLMFFILEISAGMTEFPCKYPCSWRNKTFIVYEDGQTSSVWEFSSDGQTSILNNFHILLCYQITERFLILREKGSEKFLCYPIFYDIASPLKFQYAAGVGITINNQTGELTDLCGICGEGDVYEAVAKNNPC